MADVDYGLFYHSDWKFRLDLKMNLFTLQIGFRRLF